MTSSWNWLFVFACIALVGCSAGGHDAVLSRFDGLGESLEPVDSLELSTLGIYVPTDIARADSVLVIRRGQAKNAVDLLWRDEVLHCFNIGRGPGEVLMASGSHVSDGRLYLYDIKTMRLWRMNISETIRTGRQQAELLRQYDGMSEDIGRLNRPFVIRSLPDGKALASGIFENDCWYGVLEDDCTVGSCIPYVIPDGFEDFSSKQIAALHTSNSLAVSPSGDKVAAALLGVNAISMSEYSSGRIEERFRFVGPAPLVSAPGKKNLPTLVWSPESTLAFCDLDCDDEQVYALYSGRRRGDEFPANECSWLLVFDWSGKPVKAYDLARTISAFCLDGDRIYGVSAYPDSKLYMFDI